MIEGAKGLRPAGVDPQSGILLRGICVRTIAYFASKLAGSEQKGKSFLR